MTEAADRQGKRTVRRNVLVIGAGDAGMLVITELLRHPNLGQVPVAVIDDDVTRHGTDILGVPVAGSTADIGAVAEHYDVTEALIAMPSQHGRVIRRVLEEIRSQAPGVEYRIVPGMYELLSGRVGVNRVREVRIDDLLGRPPVELDTESISRYLEGYRVMVTGAGGSIGSELIRQICRFNPESLVLFGHGENSIYALERELDRDWPHITYHSVIGAIQNGSRLDYIFRRLRPDVVFHAAAHKHVPLMELNPEEAIFNNVIGSRNLVNLALQYGVSHFVNISTDKAVNPTSVMGASKRMVEFLVRDAARHADDGQMFVSVRFGNVLGSRGSVIPVFKSQIAAGGPVTVTHPDMVRYFMTIPEATQLVLQAAGQGRNAESYILDMGEPVRIADLARELIRLSGFEPETEIPIIFTGLRPGEKLYEELLTDEERSRVTEHANIYAATLEPIPTRELTQAIVELTRAALTQDRARIRELLDAIVPGCRLRSEELAPVPGVAELPDADRSSLTEIGARLRHALSIGEDLKNSL